jgi:hypothetical protein
VETYARDLSDRRRKSCASPAIAHRILDEGLRRGQARSFQTRQSRNRSRPRGSIGDDTNYYNSITTRRVRTSEPDKPALGAIKLLLWSAIQNALAKGRYDFDRVPPTDFPTRPEWRGITKASERNSRFSTEESAKRFEVQQKA